MSLLSHGHWVGSTLKLMIMREKTTQIEVSEAARIPKNRMTDLTNARGTPAKPDEIQRLCVALRDSRQFGYQYCCMECTLGRYLGYQYSSVESGNTALSIISNLFGLEKMLGELAHMLYNNNLTPEMMARLSQIKLSIIALEVMCSEGALQAGSAEMLLLSEFIEKEKTAPK